MASNGEATDLNGKIVKQIEYYFGDVNLQRDKFLQDELKKDHGWVPIDVLLTFNRLKLITEEKATISSALKDSELVDVSEDGEKLRRNPEVPIPENSLEFWQEVKTRTVYIKGFPPETTLDDIMEYLKPHGNIVNIVMRRIKATKAFKGSIFATFKDKEEAENFTKNEEAKTFKGQELIRMMQNDYWAKEVAESKERKAAEKALKQQKKLETNQKEEAAATDAHFLKGQVLHVSGLPAENVSYNLLKEYFHKFGPVAYVVHEQGSSEADLRFASGEENAAVKAFEAIEKAIKETENGKLLFQNNEIECKVLEGEEEEKYWAEFTKNKAAKENRGHFNNRRGGRGGRGTKRQHQGGRDFRNNKKAKKEEGGDDETESAEVEEKEEKNEPAAAPAEAEA